MKHRLLSFILILGICSLFPANTLRGSEKSDEALLKSVDAMQAMAIANNLADNKLEQHMLLSWYDRDRDFESPQHASECHAFSAVPGYVDYGLYHGATLKIDIEDGRFVFFYFPVDLG